MFWIIVFSYWIHLLATVIWFGTVLLMAATAVPAFRRQMISENSWLHLQKKCLPWTNLSLVLLLLTGFLQMTNDPNYGGFLVVDNTWAWALLVKHLFYAIVLGITVYRQFGYFPAIERITILRAQKPDLALKERENWERREKQLLCPPDIILHGRADCYLKPLSFS